MLPSDPPDLCKPDRRTNHASSTQVIKGENVMGIVWAIPVRPDRLGYELSLFTEKMKQTYLPLQYFLGYTKKPGNACAKLPEELVQMITELVVHMEVPDVSVDESEWLQGYLCSQVACTSCQHVTEKVIEDYARDFDREFGMDNFDYGQPFPWEEEEDWDPRNEYGTEWEHEHGEYENADHEVDEDDRITYAAQNFLDQRAASIHLNERGGFTRRNDHDYEEQITDWILTEESFSAVEEHTEIVDGWVDLFDQAPGGCFVTLDKVGTIFPKRCVSRLTQAYYQVLKKFFGLEAFISLKPMSDADGGWRRYSCQAYLHLPTKFAYLNVDYIQRAESVVCSASNGAQIITPEMLRNISNSDRNRFTHALQVLGLKADVHPMSFGPQISSEQQENRSEDSKEDKCSRAESLKGTQWPMRIQVMKTVYGG